MPAARMIALVGEVDIYPWASQRAKRNSIHEPLKAINAGSQADCPADLALVQAVHGRVASQYRVLVRVLPLS